jgi:hypothetical protein
LTLGLWITDQVFPFQDSARVADPLLALKREPTAAQLAALTHDTPSSTLSPGLGLGVIDQAFPFQVSTKGLLVSAGRGSYTPTATQNDELVQDTPNRSTGLALFRGVGLGMIDQARPFHAAARVLTSPK